MNQYSARKIARLNLERQQNAYNAAVRSGAVTKVQGDKLLVAAPMTVEKAAQPVAPKNVKGKVEKPQLERGWSSLNDPKAKAELQQKMKAEDPKKIPLPSVEAAGANRGLIASPDGTPAPGPGGASSTSSKHDRNKKAAAAAAGSGRASAVTGPTSGKNQSGAPNESKRKGKGNAKKDAPENAIKARKGNAHAAGAQMSDAARRGGGPKMKPSKQSQPRVQQTGKPQGQRGGGGTKVGGGQGGQPKEKKGKNDKKERGH